MKARSVPECNGVSRVMDSTTEKDVTDATEVAAGPENTDVTENRAGMEKREASTEDTAHLQNRRTRTVGKR